MRLLVTGAAGYLGSEVARQAVAAGHDVIAGTLHTEPPHGRPLRLELRDDDAVHKELLRHGPQAVIHTAYRQREEALEGDVVRATRNVALAAHRFGARFVHLSTDLVFDGEIEGRYREEHEPRPVSAYGAAKAHAERIVAELHPDALVVRTSLLLGKPGPQEALALRDDVTFFEDEIRTPLHVHDLAAALLELVATDLRGPLHVAGPDAVSRLELARLLAAAQGRDPAEVRGGTAPAGRARNVALDSGRASTLLRTTLRGVAETLHPL